MAVSAGAGQILVLTSEGTILASCPPPSTIRCQIPEPNSNFVAIAAGWFHGLGLKEDGSIVAWGQNNYGQSTVPEPNSGFVSVSASKYQSLGLREDGSVAIWGCGTEAPELCVLPDPNADFIKVAAGLYHNLGLKSDGTIVAWGCVANQQFGQCESPPDNSGFVDISAGYWHSLGLQADGTIRRWGYCDFTAELDGKCLPPSGGDFVAIAAGGAHSLALRQDGSIHAWGRNDNGQCDVPQPNIGHHLIAAGGNNSFALDSDCNQNATPDTAELLISETADCDGNLKLDECEYRAVALDPQFPGSNRYLAIMPGNAGKRIALRVRMISLYRPGDAHVPDFSAFEGETRWVGEPSKFADSADPAKSFFAAPLTCEPVFRDWSDIATVYVYGSEIVPSSEYEIEIIAEGCLEPNPAIAAVTVGTSRWGDVGRPYWQANLQQPDMSDLSLLVDKFAEVPGVLSKPAAQLQPRIPDPGALVSFLDITSCVDAFRGSPYPEQYGPSPCP